MRDVNDREMKAGPPSSGEEGPVPIRDAGPAAPPRSGSAGPLSFVSHTGMAWFVLALSFLVTGAAWYLSDRAVRDKAEVRFGLQADDLSRAIGKRLVEYETALRGGAGVFGNFGSVSREQWRRYVESLRIADVYPGIQGLGYSLMMPARDVARHVAEVRAEGFPGYWIRPAGERDPTSSIVYLEPFDWRNQRAFGFDMFSEPVRRAAMTRAIESGQPAISGRVTLVQETDTDVQPGFLMYVPVYRPGMALDTPAARHRAIRGFVYSPFRIRDLMQGILGPEMTAVEFEIFDGSEPSRENLLYSTTPGGEFVDWSRRPTGDQNPYLKVTRLTIAQRTWTVVAHAPQSYLASDEKVLPMVVAGTGIAIDLFLFLIIWSMARRRVEVESLVERRTRQLSETMVRVEKTNAALQLDEARLNAMLDLSAIAPTLSEKEVQAHGLEAAQRLTGSQIGYLHFINDDQETIQLSTWSANTLRFCTAAHDDHYPVSAAGIWADAVRQRRPVLHNDYQSVPGRRGYPQGHAHLLRHLAVPVMENGEVRLIIGVGNKPGEYDETDQRQLQLIGDGIWKIVGQRRLLMRLEQARDAAEAASAAKSTFLATMSHELRTPMNAIIGMTSLARLRVEDPKVRDQLAKVDQAASQLLAIINDVLDMANIETGLLTLENSRFSLGAVLGELSVLMGERMGRKGLRLLVDYPAGFNTRFVHADAIRLRQVLFNLLANALKFSERGTVRLSAGILEERSDSLLIRWQVQDQGIGISEADQRRLFVPFEQVDSSTTRKYGGTGLGLAISKRLVALMGGEIGVASRPGEGSTFWFTTRFETAPGEAPDIESDDSRDGMKQELRARCSGTRVLLVDDEPISREVTRYLLEDLNFIVAPAEDGDAALDMARAQAFDLVLLDIHLPGRNGIDTARAIRSLPGCARVPVVGLSAGNADLAPVAWQAAGMDDGLAKPVEPDALYEMLLRWCRRADATAARKVEHGA
jgi:signal transduction histidine kinase/CHASE1-domain containing sensor protein/ActR/RegA family two-component response regulator